MTQIHFEDQEHRFVQSGGKYKFLPSKRFRSSRTYPVLCSADVVTLLPLRTWRGDRHTQTLALQEWSAGCQDPACWPGCLAMQLALLGRSNGRACQRCCNLGRHFHLSQISRDNPRVLLACSAGGLLDDAHFEPANKDYCINPC